MIAFLQRLVIPRGNLLTAEILAEVTLHILGTGEFKAISSKYEDTREKPISQRLVEGLIYTAIQIGKERGVAINWPELQRQHPFAPPAPPAPAPPR